VARRLRDAESKVLEWIELARKIQPPDQDTATEWYTEISEFRTVLRDAQLLSESSVVGLAAREFHAKTTTAIDTAQGAISQFVLFLDGVIQDPHNAHDYAEFVVERERLRQTLRDALGRLHGSLKTILTGRSR
jgi:hypothetical protein